MRNIKIAFVGDFFPGGVLVYQDKICDEKVVDVLNSADLRVATLECALGPGEINGFSFDKEKMERPDWRNIIWAPDVCVKRLKELHIDVVTIANNHIFDLGEKGLQNTIRLLDENGIKHCGAGVTSDDAAKPAVVHLDGKSIAFIGYMPFWWEAPHPPAESKAGINMLYIDKVEEDIKECKKQYDFVFVLPHWGVEHTHWPTYREKRFAERMLKAGADGIIASHPHMVQPLVRSNGKPVCYSLGNFIFPDYYMAANRPVCYPAEEEIDGIPSVLGYPKNPEKKLKSVWRPKNRIGAIFMMTISGKIASELIYTRLSDNNVSCLYKDKRLERKLEVIGTVLKMPCYGYLLRGLNILSRIKFKLTK